MAATTETVNLRLPQEVAAILDALIERKLFTNRSEAIREFCREYLHDAHLEESYQPRAEVKR